MGSCPDSPAPGDDEDWPDLLEAVADSGRQVVLTARCGEHVVLLAEDSLRALLAAAGAPGAGLPALLTARERDVLTRVAQGKTGSVIAEELGLATNTVAQHLSAARRKFNVHSSSAAVLLARAAGQIG